MTIAADNSKDPGGNRGTEHLLLGLLTLPDTVAARALAALGVSRDSVRRTVVDRVGIGVKPATGHIPFTPHMKRALEHSLREAFDLQHPYIGTEHLLLALLREPDALGALILAEQTGQLSRVRMAVLDVLSGEPPGESEPAPPTVP